MPNSSFDPLFDQWGKALNVDPQLVKTVFHLESSGNEASKDGPTSPYATIGPDGQPETAKGGMQMLPSTARAMAVKLGLDPHSIDLHDMRWAVPLATAYIAEGLTATQNPSDALAYYHGGPDPRQWGARTEAYVTRGERIYSTMALKLPDAPASEPETKVAGQ
jgi:soluble lytic murein transglycosylase-like protein